MNYNKFEEQFEWQFEWQFEELLKKRIVPAVPSNLTGRIVDAACGVSQKESFLKLFYNMYRNTGLTFLKMFSSVPDYVALPRASFVAALVVVLFSGVILGIGNAGMSLRDGEYVSLYDVGGVETYIMATDGFDYGDFL